MNHIRYIEFTYENFSLDIHVQCIQFFLWLLIWFVVLYCDIKMYISYTSLVFYTVSLCFVDYIWYFNVQRKSVHALLLSKQCPGYHFTEALTAKLKTYPYTLYNPLVKYNNTLFFRHFVLIVTVLPSALVKWYPFEHMAAFNTLFT